MTKSNNLSCVRADRMVEFFTNVESHKDALDALLQEKFGEYASVDCETVADDNGGDILVSFGRYDVREELLNFAGDVASKLGISVKSANSRLQQFLDENDMNTDFTWSEKAEDCKFELFFNGENYKKIKAEENDEESQFRLELLEALEESVKEFVDSTMSRAVQLFSNSWVMQYGAYENELED